MRLRAEGELNGRQAAKDGKRAPMRPLAVMLSAAAIGVLAEGCTRCPTVEGCGNTADYEITLKEGETKSTLANGLQVHVSVVSISANAIASGNVCRPMGGSARLRLAIDSDPPYAEEFDVSPSMCQSVNRICTPHVDLDASAGTEIVGTADSGAATAEPCVPHCVAFNDAEVSFDVEMVGEGLYDGDGGIPDGGVLSGSCLITNKSVSFTLTISE